MSTLITEIEPERGIPTKFPTTKTKPSEMKSLIIIKRTKPSYVHEVLLCQDVRVEISDSPDAKWEFPTCPVAPKSIFARECAWWYLTDGLKLQVKADELFKLGVLEIQVEPGSDAAQFIFVYGVSLPAKARFSRSSSSSRKYQWFTCPEAMTLLNNKANEVWLVPVMFGKEFGDIKIATEL